ncbi:helix-turn-helix transcriptional regulator [Streptomyces sp. CB01881]|uniref:helix-turn-helix domain-containing protein n=1 Tax=Streptomyces sp. CB01881 TaxID=2078691 RepID=UPI000CDC9921|nr:helix-turn-helix transcriptional regulator [Streptomyces sp. CB01881]AUY49764.1 transcriptional regulator [Streptomyces sp. CB01881]TYC73155.1 XRE family transcriptional regulator [Streptomyces sp. CB01881]
MSVETDEFAAMLRALKDRSGRSYGTLAARLHVSTSTLHRYCNGAAVPTEYAPVERLARVCGAGADELVELHRRWILADASRRKEPSAPAPAPDPAPASGATPGPAFEASPDPAPAPADDHPDRADHADLDRADDRRPRRLPRTRVLLSAAAVAAVAAAVIPVVALTTGTDSPHASLPPSAATPAPALAPTPSLTPTPTPTPQAPAPTAQTPEATATPSATPTPEDDKPPFHVSVLTDNWGSACGQWFLSPKSPRSVPAPPENQQTDSWAAAQNALPGGHLRLQLTAQGSEAKPVVLQALYVHVVDVRPAPKWNAYMMGSGCGGELTPAAFAVDLDAAAPRSVPVPAMEGNVKGRTTNFPYTVSATDPQVLNIDAGTVSQDVSWYLDVAWSSGDRQGKLRIGDRQDKPFRTAGLKGAPAYFYKDDHTGWSPTTTDR